MFKNYCGDVTIWTYLLHPMSPLVTILGYPLPPPPVTSFLNDPLCIFRKVIVVDLWEKLDIPTSYNRICSYQALL